MLNQFTISTKHRHELVDITNQVEDVVADAEVEEGVAVVFTPHSTAAIVLTENEPGLLQDWENFLSGLVAGYDFKHNRIDDNADSHLLSGLLGQEKILIVNKGALLRGTWQNIFLAELDGPRDRKVTIKIQ